MSSYIRHPQIEMLHLQILNLMINTHFYMSQQVLDYHSDWFSTESRIETSYGKISL